jgi:CelD/BcsL family acetyltransferase involved in cellulose biosynthesis
LAPDELEFWRVQHATNPRYDSAFFHPGFAAAVDDSGRAVSVVVGRDTSGAVTALMPFNRDGTSMRPLGWPGTDFQGPILAPGGSVDPLDLLPAGVKSFEFDHLLEVADGFQPWITARNASPYVDTDGGMDAYLGRASKSGRQNMSQARRRVAKAEREIGPVRFHADVVDDVLLQRVIALKRGQYKATGARDYFADARRIGMLTQLLHTRGVDFNGVLSAVYAGDHLLAAHFGIRANGVLHWWFPVYDPEFSSLAPGWILLRELVMAAPEMGVRRIDLGRGEDNYKRWAKTGETVVCAGYVSSSRMRIAARRARERSIEAAKDSPLGPKLRQMARGWRARGD